MKSKILTKKSLNYNLNLKKMIKNLNFSKNMIKKLFNLILIFIKKYNLLKLYNSNKIHNIKKDIQNIQISTNLRYKS